MQIIFSHEASCDSFGFKKLSNQPPFFSHTLRFVLKLEIKSWVHLSQEYLELFTRQGFFLECSKFANVVLLHFRRGNCPNTHLVMPV